jgi:hypothetical protein
MTTVRRVQRVLAALGFVASVSVALGAAADDPCGFAYGFCMPIWNDCVTTTGDWLGCQQMLDQCLLANGCGTLP